MASMRTCTTCNQKYEIGFIGMVGQAILPDAGKCPGEPGPAPVNSSARDESMKIGMRVGKRSGNMDFQYENGPKNYTNSARRRLCQPSRRTLIRGIIMA